MPEPALFPADPARRAEMELFLDWFDRVWKVAPSAIEADPPPLPALSAAMDAHLDRFEALLSDRDHLLAAQLSAADCAAYPFLKYAAGREPGDDELFHRVLDEHQGVEGRPALAAWIERVASR